MNSRKDDYCIREDTRKGSRIEATETTRTSKIIEIADIRKENIDQTTPWQWLTNQRSFPNPEDMMTSKTYVAHCTLMGSTPSEIATPSMIDTQEKTVRGTLKKTTRKRRRQARRQGIPKNQGDNSSDLRWDFRF